MDGVSSSLWSKWQGIQSSSAALGIPQPGSGCPWLLGKTQGPGATMGASGVEGTPHDDHQSADLSLSCALTMFPCPGVPRVPGASPQAHPIRSLSRPCAETSPPYKANLWSLRKTHPELGDARSLESLSLRNVKKKKSEPRHLCPPSAPEAPWAQWAQLSGPSSACLFMESLRFSTSHPPGVPPWVQAPSWGQLCCHPVPTHGR